MVVPAILPIEMDHRILNPLRCRKWKANLSDRPTHLDQVPTDNYLGLLDE